MPDEDGGVPFRLRAWEKSGTERGTDTYMTTRGGEEGRGITAARVISQFP